jgi:hypothetical protein
VWGVRLAQRVGALGVALGRWGETFVAWRRAVGKFVVVVIMEWMSSIDRDRGRDVRAADWILADS